MSNGARVFIVANSGLVTAWLTEWVYTNRIFFTFGQTGGLAEPITFHVFLEGWFMKKKVICLDRDPGFSSFLVADLEAAGIEVVSAATPAQADKAFYFDLRDEKARPETHLVIVAAESPRDLNLHFAFALVDQSDWPRNHILILSDDPDLSAISLESHFHFLLKGGANLPQKIVGIFQDPETLVVSASPIRFAERFPEVRSGEVAVEVV